MIINARELVHVNMNVNCADLKAFTNLENIELLVKKKNSKRNIK